ncbi:hypothetical protein ACA910_018135 [Epithemia clementina (nom. ined.)]
MQALERDEESDEEMVTSPVTYTPSLYELLRDAKIEVNRKYLESIGLKKAASELKKQASPSKKESKTVSRLPVANHPIPPQHLQKGYPEVAKAMQAMHASQS